jgi:hypothetical protein
VVALVATELVVGVDPELLGAAPPFFNLSRRPMLLLVGADRTRSGTAAADVGCAALGLLVTDLKEDVDDAVAQLFLMNCMQHRDRHRDCCCGFVAARR